MMMAHAIAILHYLANRPLISSLSIFGDILENRKSNTTDIMGAPCYNVRLA